MKWIKIILPFIFVVIIIVIVVNLCSLYFQSNYLKKNRSFEELKKTKKVFVMPTGVKGTHKVAEWNSKVKFKQAPELDGRKLPPVKERLPENPLVIIPAQQCGPYGGKLYRAGSGPSDIEAGIGYLMVEGLIKRSPDARRLLLNLASDFKILEKGKVFQFTLRKGLRWSDGKPFTTADIEFWYKHILHNSKITPVISSLLKSPDGKNFILEVKDKYKLSFRFPEPTPQFIKFLECPLPWHSYIFPAHYLNKFHAEFADQTTLDKMCKAEGYSDWGTLFLEKSKYHMNPDLPTMSAWSVKTPLPASPVRFVRNPYYWKVDPKGNQLPYINELIVSVMDQSATTLAAQYGKLDFQARGIAPNSRTLLLENEGNNGYKLSSSLTGSPFGGINFNLNSPDKYKAELFRHPKFKQAMSMGVDRKALVDAFCNGIGSYNQTSFLKISPYYRKEDAEAFIEFNPQKANKLLDQLGLNKRDSRGFRCRPDGSPLVIYLEQPSVSMKGNQASPLLLMCRYWQQQLGMNIIYKAEARGLFYTRNSAGIHDMMWGGSNDLTIDGSLESLAPGRQQSRWCPKWNQWFNSNGKKGEKPPALVIKIANIRKQLESEIDEKKRVKMFYELLDVNRENLWIICSINGPPSLYVVNERMRNVPEVIIRVTTIATESFVKTEEGK